MQLRTTILRLLLGSLALAAAAGVLAVLLPLEDVMVRVTMTGVTTAVAAGLLMVLTLLIDRDQLRPAGLLGASVVVVEFLLALSLIWLSFALPGRVEEKLGLTMGTLALAGTAVLLSLLVIRTGPGRLAGFVGTGSAAAMLACFLLGTWLPGSAWSNDQWWGTGWVVGFFGMLAAISRVDAGAKQRRRWRGVGVAASIGATCFALVAIWDELKFDEEILAITIGLACTAAFGNLVLRVTLPAGQRWVPIATVLSAAGTALAVDLAVLLDRYPVDEFLEKLAAASGIVTGCGAMAIVVLVALNRRGVAATRAEPDREMVIVCPMCGRKQRVPVGRSNCGGCGLHIDIRIAEPRCAACDYQLTGITSGRCPECGAYR